MALDVQQGQDDVRLDLLQQSLDAAVVVPGVDHVELPRRQGQVGSRSDGEGLPQHRHHRPVGIVQVFHRQVGAVPLDHRAVAVAAVVVLGWDLLLVVENGEVPLPHHAVAGDSQPQMGGEVGHRQDEVLRLGKGQGDLPALGAQEGVLPHPGLVFVRVQGAGVQPQAVAAVELFRHGTGRPKPRGHGPVVVGDVEAAVVVQAVGVEALPQVQPRHATLLQHPQQPARLGVVVGHLRQGKLVVDLTELAGGLDVEEGAAQCLLRPGGEVRHGDVRLRQIVVEVADGLQIAVV